MIEAWKKFFGTGWLHGQEPSKQDCFKAGYEAAIDYVKNQSRWIVKQDSEIDVGKFEAGRITYIPKAGKE